MFYSSSLHSSDDTDESDYNDVEDEFGKQKQGKSSEGYSNASILFD